MPDLTKLKQSEAAWLIGKPTSWLRDNGHRFSRNTDGTYDGREVFQVVAKLAGTVEITDLDLAELVEYAKDPKNCETCHHGRQCEFHQ
jgi:hypothetical protein